MTATHHEYCWSLLPWFVTGRVSASDAQRIERHLLECPACQIELEQQRQLCDAFRRDDPVMLAPQASLQKLMAKIDASVPDAPLEALETPSAERHALRSTRRAPHWLAIAAAIQTVAIAALLTIVWRQTASEMTAPRFTTMTSAAATRTDHAMVRIVFKPDMTTAQLQSLLHANDAQVLAGPTEAGVYTLQMSRAETADGLSAMLERLRGDANVVFAELVKGETP